MTCLVIEELSSVHGGGVTYINELLRHYKKKNNERVIVIVSDDVASTLKGVSDIDVVSVSGFYNSLFG